MTKRQFTAVPAARSDAKSLRTKQRLLIGAWMLLATLGPLSFILTVTRGEPAALTPAAVVVDQHDVVSFSEIVGRDFLAGRATLLPATEGVDTRFGFSGDTEPFDVVSLTTHQVFPTTIDTVRGSTPVTIVTFRVQTAAGRILNLNITTTRDGRNQLLLASQPSINVPVLGAGNSTPAVSYADITSAVPITPEMITAVNQWATAYVRDDRSQLKVLIDGAAAGDAPRGDYIGLAGFELVGPATVTAAATHPTVADMVYARIRFTMEATDLSFRTVQEMDVLLSRPGTPDPRVVAWGPTGTGALLLPFRNNTAYTG